VPRVRGGIIPLGAAGAAAVGGEHGVSGPATGDEEPASTGRVGTREASPRELHVGKAFPAMSRVGKVKPVDRRRGGGLPQRVAAGVEARPAEDVEVAANGEGGKVGEAVKLRRTGERREGPPGGRCGGVEQDRGGEGWVGGEEAEKVAARETEATAEREERSRREEQAPSARGGAEAGLVGEGEQAENDSCNVVREPRD
jgi:hypothetical protein